MRNFGNQLVGLSGALMALLLALATAYLSVDRRVNALASTMVTMPEVEHMVELKTSEKLDDIIRRLARIENQMAYLPRKEVSGIVRNTTEEP